MSRTGMRGAKLNEKTRLKLIIQPGHRFNLQSYPYLYRVGLETIINDYPSTSTSASGRTTSRKSTLTSIAC